MVRKKRYELSCANLLNGSVRDHFVSFPIVNESFLELLHPTEIIFGRRRELELRVDDLNTWHHQVAKLHEFTTTDLKQPLPKRPFDYSVLFVFAFWSCSQTESVPGSDLLENKRMSLTWNSMTFVCDTNSKRIEQS
jgi:hypothetical protein